MPPTLVHGVDISALEGWMVKINSNPSVFGKNTSRRWFRVSFVPAGNDQKLIISYSTNKTTKEPRGWLYIEDVSGVYCRRDMIEVVSPARTLRFKGETTVEHRLWSDSLHRLCNPPKPEPVQQEKRVATKEAPREKDRERIADPKPTREHTEAARERAPPAEEAKPAHKSVVEADARGQREASPEEEHRPRRGKEEERKRVPSEHEDHRDSRRRQENDREDEASYQSSDGEDEDEEERAPPARRQSQEDPRQSPPPNSSQRRQERADSSEERPRGRQQQSSPRRDERDQRRPSPRREEEKYIHNDSDKDSDDGEEDEEEEEEPAPRQAKRDAPLERRPSLLVASIKSLSPCVATPAEPKPVATKAPTPAPAQAPRQPAPPAREAKAGMSDDEDDASEQEDESPQEESPREETRPKAVAPPVQDVQKKTQEVQKKAPKSTDYFDDENDEEEDDQTNNKRRPSIPAVAVKAPTGSEIRADNNFAEEDWDADDADTHSKHTAAARASPEKRASVGFGGVAADSNFATEDWD